MGFQEQKCSSKGKGRKEGHHSTNCPLMSNCSISLGSVGTVSAPNASALSSTEMSGVHPVPVPEVQLFMWAGRLSASCHAGASMSYLPGWCLGHGKGRFHIRHRALCCTLSCWPAWLSSPLTITHLPLPLALSSSQTCNTNQTWQRPLIYLPKG